MRQHFCASGRDVDLAGHTKIPYLLQRLASEFWREKRRTEVWLRGKSNHACKARATPAFAFHSDATVGIDRPAGAWPVAKQMADCQYVWTIPASNREVSTICPCPVDERECSAASTQTQARMPAVISVTGAPIQAPLDALEALLKQRSFEADQVRQVIVRIATSAAAIVNNREMPDVCLQHMVAVMLLDKTASFQAAHDKERMKNAEVLKQRAKVQLIGDAELEKIMPRREAIVEITLTGGAKLTQHITAVRGTPANPMPREEVVGKARGLMAPVLGAATAATLIDKIMALENVKSLRELRPLLHRS
jgi:hypothetical protein